MTVCGWVPPDWVVDERFLFTPMAERGGIIQFDKDSAELDAEDKRLVDKIFSDRGGASYFFVVARASPEGAVQHNRELSRARAEAVMGHLQQAFQDHHGLQCGVCTPGLVMSAAALLKENPRPTEAEDTDSPTR